eukprot:gene18991-biopygen12990
MHLTGQWSVHTQATCTSERAPWMDSRGLLLFLRPWQPFGIKSGHFLSTFPVALSPATGRLRSHLASILDIFYERSWRPRRMNWTQSTDAKRTHRVGRTPWMVHR